MSNLAEVNAKVDKILGNQHFTYKHINLNGMNFRHKNINFKKIWKIGVKIL